MAGSVPIPKYIQVVYDESDAVPCASSVDMSETCCQLPAITDNNPRQPYEVPIVLAKNYSSSSSSTSCSNNKDLLTQRNHSTLMNMNENSDVPSIVVVGGVSTSNCSSLSSPGGDESMQALLPLSSQ